MKTLLSVNLNKVALVRNTRRLGIPSVIRAAQICLAAGAHGITVHPRPDERHIRPHDVTDLAAILKEFPRREFNLEGNPEHNLLDYVRAVRPQQATFVPDAVEQFTSDHGWDLRDAAVCARLKPLIAAAHDCVSRVSLFMDADAEAVPRARDLGAERVELYTEPYAAAVSARAEVARQLQRYAAAARAAQAAGLSVNAGHDLNLHNLAAFLRAVPGIAEVSIGHAFIADALEIGYSAAVKRYLQCLSKQ